MWIESGHYAALTAFFLTLVQIAAPVTGIMTKQPAWIRVGRYASFAVFALLTVASASVVISFLQHDFSVRYVAGHSSRSLPIFYLATGLWGGHEGSLLLWTWLLSLYGAVAAWRHWQSHSRSMPWVLIILGAVLLGFLMLTLFLSSPFERLFPPPVDGRDLNPLLQDPGMVFHPPFLYMGYVGFAIPYAFAMAALISGKAGNEWILATRRWTLFSWLMLTAGIVFGAYWAYYELGWGGYWAWDPVENASFMPWLTATAFFHSVMVQERRGMFKTWNLFLIITTFALSLLGTFLVRSGVLSSVHAFATDPGKGVFILAFMAVMLLFSFGVLAVRSDLIRTPVKLESMICRESAYLFNNLFFIIAMITVLLGTLYPLAVETLSDNRVSVGAPYFNKVFIPIMLGMLFLMGTGPLIPWRRVSTKALKRNFGMPLVVALVGLIVAFVLQLGHPYGIVAMALIFFTFATHMLDIWRGIMARRSARGDNPLKALFGLVSRNRRRYGGFIVHAGILMMCLGFIGSGLFQEERDLVMKVGDSVRMGSWQITFQKMGERRQDNWQAREAHFVALRDDGARVSLYPQKRFYAGRNDPTTEAAIHTTWQEDIYLVLGDAVGQGWNIRAYRNPLVVWIWWGTLVMVAGIAVALTRRRG